MTPQLTHLVASLGLIVASLGMLATLFVTLPNSWAAYHPTRRESLLLVIFFVVIILVLTWSAYQLIAPPFTDASPI